MDAITELHNTRRHHLHIVAAINETLDAIQHDPITALQVACSNYDLRHDPEAIELAAALAATIPDEWANDL